MLRHTGDLVWVKRGEPTPPHLIATLLGSVHVWGVVWDTGQVFAMYTGQINKEVILDSLNNHLSPHLPGLAGRVFVADGATYQWTADVRGWLYNAGLNALKLPPHSPNFNAIEQCWHWIKQRVKAQAPAILLQLRGAMQNAIQAVPQNNIMQYIRKARREIRDYQG